MKRLIGAHLSISGGLRSLKERVIESRSNTFQFFISPPQSFRKIEHSDEDVNDFRVSMIDIGIPKYFIHGIYLLNFGSTDSEIIRKSKESLTYYLRVSEKIGAQGVILHPGSHKGLGFDAVKWGLADALKEVIFNVPGSTKVILETSVGQGGCIGSKFSELSFLRDNSVSERISFCIDTQHLFAAGYDISSKDGIEKTISLLDSTLGLRNILVIHFNDSKVPFNSAKDRHADIGEGFIGIEGLSRVLKHLKFSKIPFILETPNLKKPFSVALEISRVQHLLM